MRRRPPVTVVAYIASVAAILLAGFITDGADPRLLVGGVVLGAGAAGLYVGSRLAWILVTALHTVNLLVVLVNYAAWWNVAILIAMLALLLAPPPRRHLRREPPPARGKVTRTGLLVRFGVVVAVGLLLGLVGVALLFRPDAVNGDLELVRSERPGLRVLFIGNTLSSDNSMPRMVGRLAEGDRRAPPIFAVQYARRGSALEDALDDGELTALLQGERWNQVVLQEHSQIASRPDDREAHTVPAAIALDEIARAGGAHTVLFSTWGYEDGDREAVHDDTYRAMQARLNQGYVELTSRLSALLAPVGLAWEAARRREPDLDLWADDGRRPSRTGSYLTACVFYALMTHRNPTESRFTAGLDVAQAQSLRRIAEESVRQTQPQALPRQP